MSRHLIDYFAKHRLTPAQRRIAQTLAEHSADLEALSTNQVAELAQVSQPSVTRLASAVGFSGYTEFRRFIADLVTSDTDSELAPPNEFQRAVSAEIQNLEALNTRLSDRTTIRRAGALIMASKPVGVIGLRAAAHLAGYFTHYAAKVHPDVHSCRSSRPEVLEQISWLRDAGATHLVVFALPRYPEDLVRAVRHARNCGLSLVTVTDSEANDFVEQSEIVLRADVSSRLIFDSHAAAFLLSSLLVQAMCDEAPHMAQRRLDEGERLATREHFYARP